MGLPPNAPGPLPELCGSSGGFDFTSFLRSSLYLHRRSFLPSPASPPASNSPLPNTHAHTHTALPTFSPDPQPWTRPLPFPFSPCTASKRLPMGPEAWIPTWGRGPDASSGGGAGCESGSGAGCESGPGAGCESGGRMLKPALGQMRIRAPDAETGGGQIRIRAIRMLKPLASPPHAFTDFSVFVSALTTRAKRHTHTHRKEFGVFRFGPENTCETTDARTHPRISACLFRRLKHVRNDTPTHQRVVPALF